MRKTEELLSFDHIPNETRSLEFVEMNWNNPDRTYQRFLDFAVFGTMMGISPSSFSLYKALILVSNMGKNE